MEFCYIEHRESEMAAACLLLAMKMTNEGQWVSSYSHNCHCGDKITNEFEFQTRFSLVELILGLYFFFVLLHRGSDESREFCMCCVYAFLYFTGWHYDPLHRL